MKADFIGNLVVKQGVNIEIIGPFRRCRHAQEERWLKVVKYLLIRRRSPMMDFIHDDVVKGIGSKGIEDVIAG